MVWIEIIANNTACDIYSVTTFAVVWIEIPVRRLLCIPLQVTTFAVVWIEISRFPARATPHYRHHLRGGVD